jgi:hypothetical protein
MHSLRTYLLQALADPAARDAAGPEALVSAENPCHQAIFMNHGPSAVTPLDPELIEVGDAIGQRAQRRDPPIWRPLRRLRVAVDATMINFLATDLNGLVRILKRTLRDWGWSTQARK